MNHLVSRLIPLALCAWLTFGAGTGRAELIYNNFGPGDSYNTNRGYLLGGLPPPSQDIAMPFTVTGTSYNLESISLALGYISGLNLIQIWLMSEAGGLPGSILESWTLTNVMRPFGQNNPPVTVLSSRGTLLEAGNTYYVAAIAADDVRAAWNFNSTGDLGPFAFRQGGGRWDLDNHDRGALRVTGNDVVPEPATLTLLAIGSVGLVGYGWRRRKAA